MKKSLLLAIILFCSTCIFAQNELLVHSHEKNIFLNHQVVAKESFYSIGRLYNVTPKDIAALNGIDMNKGLEIGQQLKIPLNKTNFSQSADKGRPVYYSVGASEGLYRVSLKNNNVLMANLRKWNNLPDDKIKTGQLLIVGYLISPEANKIVAAPPVEIEHKDVPPPPQDVVTEKKEVVPEKKETVPEKKDAVVEKKDEAKPIEEERKIVPPPVKPGPTQASVSNVNGGYFKTQFDAQVKVQPLKKDETASAGIFKTASGWQDYKYYALMDKVEPGTIVRIINPTNSKTIYAKVLGEMSGIRQNQGYDVRISNAAASALDVTDTDKFIIRVNY